MSDQNLHARPHPPAFCRALFERHASRSREGLTRHGRGRAPLTSAAPWLTGPSRARHSLTRGGERGAGHTIDATARYSRRLDVAEARDERVGDDVRDELLDSEEDVRVRVEKGHECACQTALGSAASAEATERPMAGFRGEAGVPKASESSAESENLQSLR